MPLAKRWSTYRSLDIPNQVGVYELGWSNNMCTSGWEISPLGSVATTVKTGASTRSGTRSPTAEGEPVNEKELNSETTGTRTVNCRNTTHSWAELI